LGRTRRAPLRGQNKIYKCLTVWECHTVRKKAFFQPSIGKVHLAWNHERQGDVIFSAPGRNEFPYPSDLSCELTVVTDSHSGVFV